MSALIPGDWALDYSTDTPILLHKKCSVIEGEHAKELYQFILEIPQIESLKKELAKANGQGMLVEDMNNDGELSASITELESALSAERAKNAAVIAEATGYRDRVTELEKEVANLRDGSELWDALIGCARILVYGTAGLGECGELKDESNYAHIGAELWTMHGATTDDYSRACFVSFAQAARELRAMKGTP